VTHAERKGPDFSSRSVGVSNTVDFLSLTRICIVLINFLSLASATLSFVPDYINRNQIAFWWDGDNESTVKPTVLNGHNNTCRHAKTAMFRYLYGQINLLVDVVENELNDGCTGGKSVLKTGAPPRGFWSAH